MIEIVRGFGATISNLLGVSTSTGEMIGVGIIWYVAGQDSTVSELQETVVALEETIEEMGENLEEAVKTQAVITNEMRTIMSDHNGFGDVLRELGQSGALPSGERRSYGGY